MVADDDEPFLSSSMMYTGSPSLPPGFDESNQIILHKKALWSTRFEIWYMTLSDTISLLLILALDVVFPFIFSTPLYPPPPPPYTSECTKTSLLSSLSGILETSLVQRFCMDLAPLLDDEVSTQSTQYQYDKFQCYSYQSYTMIHPNYTPYWSQVVATAVLPQQRWPPPRSPIPSPFPPTSHSYFTYPKFSIITSSSHYYFIKP